MDLRILHLRGSFCPSVLLGLLILVGSVIGSISQDWVGFHGLEKQGVHSSTNPAHSPSQVQMIWKTPIPGKGYSSPTVAGEKVYVTTAYEKRVDSRVRVVLTVLNNLLVWLVLVGAVVLAFASLEGGGAKREFKSLARMFMLISVVIPAFALTLFGRELFDLDDSLFRSWKVAVGSTCLALSAALLFGSIGPAALTVFAVANTILSVVAYVTNPLPEAFFNFRSSDGVSHTAVILGPGLMGWLVASAGLILRRQLPFPAMIGTAPGRSTGFQVLLSCALAVGVTVGGLWMLVQRMIKTNKSPFQQPDAYLVTPEFQPELGWFAVAACGIAAVVLIVVSLFGLKRRISIKPVAATGWIASVLLGLGNFVSTYGFPASRQMAYAVVSLNKQSGAIEWLRELAYGATVSDFKPINSHATPSIAIGSNKLCAYFGSAGLFGFNPEGTLAWRVTDAQFYSTFGVGHSPVVAHDIVILTNDNERRALGADVESQIAAFGLKDGKQLWRQNRDRVRLLEGGFCSPLVRTIKNKRTVLMRGWEDLTAYDLHTGEILWTHRLRHRGNILVASMVTDEKRIYLIDEVGVQALSLDALCDGRAPVEWTVRIPGPKVSTPSIADGLLFGATETGVAFCIDVEDGSLQWREKLGGRFFSSVVVHGDSVIFANESGEVFVVASDKVFNLIGRTKLAENIYATPAPQTNGLLLRGATNMHFLRFVDPKESTLSLK
jgi:outer membrane protein assembly factor BamB